MPLTIKREREMGIYEGSRPWVYIYGRRKTGKTFFVKNFVAHDDYYFVGRDGHVWDKEMDRIDIGPFREILKRTIGFRSIVIDEFHRLPPDIFDMLHAMGRKGYLTVLSSTLWYSKKLLGQGSPLLGLFTPMPFGLAPGKEVIATIEGMGEPDEIVKASAFLQEPILLEGYNGNIDDKVPRFIWSSGALITGMVREIFDEEERTISAVYDGIMECVASGKETSGEISSVLFSKGIMAKDNPGLLSEYFKVLIEIGILKKLNVVNKRRTVYRHVSPLLALYFYLRSKYGFGETEVPLSFVDEVYRERLPRIVEDHIATMICDDLGLKRLLMDDPEIDMVGTKFDRMEVIGEVKWGEFIGRCEAERIADKLNSFDVKRRIIVVRKKGNLPDRIRSVEIVDPKKLITMLKMEI